MPHHYTTSDVLRFQSKIKVMPSDCHEWQGQLGNDGYGRISIGGSMMRAHRVAFELVNGPIQPGMHVLHRCDNPPCCNPDHLFLGTQADNMRDMKSKNRAGRHSAKGESHPRAKLTESIVVAIREAYEKGELQKDIAKRYDVAQITVSNIVTRKRWIHI